jgi:hypothetical protein
MTTFNVFAYFSTRTWLSDLQIPAYETDYSVLFALFGQKLECVHLAAKIMYQKYVNTFKSTIGHGAVTISIYECIFKLSQQGVTLKVENGQLVISRIIHGGMIDRQGIAYK